MLFENCEFLGNSGAGYVADSGRHSDVHFRSCRFTGESSSAVYLSKRGHTFDKCVIVGVFFDTSTDSFGGVDEGFATRWIDCVFSDDTQWTLTGKLYGAPGPSGGTGAQGQAHFVRCYWDYRSGAMSPSPLGQFTRCTDCKFNIAAPGTHSIQGTLDGTTYLIAGSIYSGRHDLGPGVGDINGRLIVAGVEQFVGSKIVDWPNIPPGASATTTVRVAGARSWDKRSYVARMSSSMEGAILSASVSAHDTVTVIAINPSRGPVDIGPGTLTVVGLTVG
jgi:hypothetical protein